MIWASSKLAPWRFASIHLEHSTLSLWLHMGGLTAPAAVLVFACSARDHFILTAVVGQARWLPFQFRATRVGVPRCSSVNTTDVFVWITVWLVSVSPGYVCCAHCYVAS